MPANEVLLRLKDERLIRLHTDLYLHRLEEIRNTKEKHKEIIRTVTEELEVAEEEESMYRALLIQLEATPTSELVDVTADPFEKNGHYLSLSSIIDSAYDQKWSLVNKTRYVLSLNGNRKELGTREICELLIREEPGIVAHHGSMDKLQKNLGSSLLQKIAKKIIFYRIQQPMSDGKKQIIYAYGLKEWRE